MDIREALVTIQKKIRGGTTYTKDNHIEKIVVHVRNMPIIPAEYEINYENWGGHSNGGLKVEMFVYVSKLGILFRDSHATDPSGHEINLTWDQIDAMRRELCQ